MAEDGMPEASVSDDVLVLASGEIAAWQNGRYVSAHQAEWHQMGSGLFRDSEPTLLERRYQDGEWQIGVVQLADGTWLAHPPGLSLWSPRHPSREAALRHAVNRIVRRARRRRRGPWPESMRLHWPIGAECERTVIAWAYRVLGMPAPKVWQAPRKVEVKASPGPRQRQLFEEAEYDSARHR